MTVQRQVILQVLEEAGEHLTIKQVTERIQHRYPSVNLSTVYRNLELLIQMGIVRANYFPIGGTTYELSTEKSHGHLVCLRCHMVQHLDVPLPESLSADIQATHRFHRIAFTTTITGYCDACWAAGNEGESLVTDHLDKK